MLKRLCNKLSALCVKGAGFKSQSFKPIFHCDAKLFALGTFASPNTKDSTFALPNAKNTNMLVSLALGDANFSPYVTQKPQCESVEYRLRLGTKPILLRWPCTFHVFCVDLICVWCPTQTQFPVEYGLNFYWVASFWDSATQVFLDRWR